MEQSFRLRACPREPMLQRSRQCGTIVLREPKLTSVHRRASRRVGILVNPDRFRWVAIRRSQKRAGLVGPDGLHREIRRSTPAANLSAERFIKSGFASAVNRPSAVLDREAVRWG